MEQPTFISPSIINYGPMADTDERRAVVRRLTDALYLSNARSLSMEPGEDGGRAGE